MSLSHEARTVLNFLTMSSREIAELTGKLHTNVLRDIRNMLDDLGQAELSFESSYQDTTGRTLPMYSLPKDLTITLVSGYNVTTRHRIVTRWMELEAQQGPKLPTTMAEALRLAADQAEQIERQQAALAIAAPKAAFAQPVGHLPNFGGISRTRVLR